MRRGRHAAARAVAVAVGAALACAAHGAAPPCVVVGAAPEGGVLGAYPLDAGEPAFALRYTHSVTRTPVEERYRVDGEAIVQTQLRFVEHGPGLPTHADAGGTWTREDGQFVLRLARPLGSIAARVDPAQSPTLVAGAGVVDLAQWGRRPIHLYAQAACTAHEASRR